MVEFALILFPLLLLVAGIIQFGIALELLARHAAHREPGRAPGARWAAVNNWPPDCPRGSASCPTPNTLQESLKRQALSAGLKAGVTVQLCYPAGTKDRGDPVRVQLAIPFKLVPILGVRTLDLKAKATMRLEQTQDPAKGGVITGEVACT